MRSVEEREARAQKRVNRVGVAWWLAMIGFIVSLAASGALQWLITGKWGDRTFGPIALGGSLVFAAAAGYLVWGILAYMWDKFAILQAQYVHAGRAPSKRAATTTEKED